MTAIPARRQNHCQNVYGQNVVASSKNAISRKTNRKKS
jgi:hypothetical protein